MEKLSSRTKCFTLLSDLGIISLRLANKLENIKGMKDLMIHQYDDFDQNLFIEKIKDIIVDTKLFIKQIKK